MNIKSIWDNMISKTGFLYREKRPVEGDVIVKMPHYRQNQTYTCGWVSALMCIHKFDPKFDGNRALKVFRPDREYGVSTTGMIRGMRKLGFVVSRIGHITFNEVKEAIENGWPIISLIRLHGDDYHWMVIVGVSKKYVHMHGHRDDTLSWKSFKKQDGGCINLIVKGKREGNRHKG